MYTQRWPVPSVVTQEPLAKPLFPGIKTESDGARIRIGARTPFYFASSSEECNKSVVAATLQQLHKVRALGTPRQLIAVACSIRHANQVAALYRAHGLIVEVLHSDLPDDERA